MLWLRSESYCFQDRESLNSKFSSIRLSKRTLEESGERPVVKYWQILDKAVNLKPFNRGLKPINKASAFYEQSKTRLICFFLPKRSNACDGIHKKLNFFSNAKLGLIPHILLFLKIINFWNIFIALFRVLKQIPSKTYNFTI